MISFSYAVFDVVLMSLSYLGILLSVAKRQNERQATEQNKHNTQATKAKSKAQSTNSQKKDKDTHLIKIDSCLRDVLWREEEDSMSSSPPTAARPSDASTNESQEEAKAAASVAATTSARPKRKVARPRKYRLPDDEALKRNHGNVDPKPENTKATPPSKKRKFGKDNDDDDEDFNPLRPNDLKTSKKPPPFKYHPETKEEKEKRKQAARDAEFDKWFAQLERYKAKHGDCEVPCKNDHSNFTELSFWVQRIRKQYKQVRRKQPSQLTLQQMVRLTEIGFVFTNRPQGFTHFEERIRACEKFKREHGHLLIPVSHPELGRWVDYVRLHYKNKYNGDKHSLTDDREQLLTSMGFVWQVGERVDRSKRSPPKTWDERLEEFKDFLQIHGHPYVPQHMAGGLGRWCATQRQHYKVMKGLKPPANKYRALSKEEFRKLSDAGFAWDASSIRRTPKSAVEMPIPMDFDLGDDDSSQNESEATRFHL